jgi:hypothetical protein
VRAHTCSLSAHSLVALTDKALSRPTTLLCLTSELLTQLFIVSVAVGNCGGGILKLPRYFSPLCEEGNHPRCGSGIQRATQLSSCEQKQTALRFER